MLAAAISIELIWTKHPRQPEEEGAVRTAWLVAVSHARGWPSLPLVRALPCLSAERGN